MMQLHFLELLFLIFNLAILIRHYSYCDSLIFQKK